MLRQVGIGTVPVCASFTRTSGSVSTPTIAPLSLAMIADAVRAGATARPLVSDGVGKALLAEGRHLGKNPESARATSPRAA